MLRGAVTRTAGRGNIAFLGGSQTTFLGGTTGLSYATWSGTTSPASHVTLNGPYTGARLSFSSGTYTLLGFGDAGVSFSESYCFQQSGRAVTYMGRKNVFCKSADATSLEGNIVYVRNDGEGTVDLNGYDQIITGFIRGGTLDEATYEIRNTADDEAILHVMNPVPKDKTVATSYGIKFTGKLALSFEGPRALTLTAASTAVGALSLTNGANIVLGPSATWGGASVNVGGENTVLTFKKRAAFPEKPEIQLVDGGKIMLDWTGSALPVGKLTVGGVEQKASGTYGAEGSGADHELSSLLGTGMFYVEQKAGEIYTFNAAQGAVDTSVSVAGNWLNQAKPDFTTGEDVAVFAAQGDRATFDTAVALYGVTFGVPAGGSYTLADGGGSLTLGTGGFSIPTPGENDEARTVTNAVPTTVVGPTEWALYGKQNVFVQSGARAGNVQSSVTVTGEADVYLSGDGSAFHGTTTFNSDDTHPGCVVHVTDGRAMGAKGAGFVMNKLTTAAGSGLRLLQLAFDRDTTVDADITLHAGLDSMTARVKYASGITVAYNGKVVNDLYLRDMGQQGYRATRVVYAGGYDFGAGLWGVPNKADYDGVGKGGVVLTNLSGRINQISLPGTMNVSPDYNPALLQIFTPTNVWGNGGYGVKISGSSKVECHAYQAVMTNHVGTTWYPNFQYAKYDGVDYLPVFDLGGFDQSVASIYETTALSDATVDALKGVCLIRSAEPATLTAVQAGQDQTVSALSFRGKVCFNLMGTKTLTMRKTPSPTTGTLQVDGGKLVLQEGAAWTNAENVVVKNAGALTLNDSKLLNRKGTVDLSSDATLTLGEGTENVTKFLVVDGTSKASGYYGSSECADPRVPSENKLSVLSGTGVLCCRGTPGVLLIVR